MKRIQILLSCYNGERFVREQLESYLALDNYDEVKVLIRDDGSQDGTRAILEEFRDKHGFEVVFGENVGFNASMHELILMRDKSCEYFAYSDQDDVWLSDKLSSAVSFIEKSGKEGALAYCAMSSVTDEELRVKGKTLRAKKPLSFYNAIVQNVCIGHTIVFNSELSRLLEREYSDDILMTDYWTYLIASSLGHVLFEPKETTLYRQHASNAVGYQTKTLKTILMRLTRALTTKKAEKNTKQLKAFLECYADLIPDEYKREADRFIKKQKNFFTRLTYIFTTKAYRQSFSENLVFRLMYLFGKYKIKTKKLKEH